jgi:hypothetical protein
MEILFIISVFIFILSFVIGYITITKWEKNNFTGKTWILAFIANTISFFSAIIALSMIIFS